jgi:cytoskeletal protein CcmA (bactofilin family)
MFTKKPDRPGSVSSGLADALKPQSASAGPTSSYPTSWGNNTVKGIEKMSPSVIGADLTITGSLQSKGEVNVEGEIQGDIQCASLLVGDTARITGNVVAEDVIVRGHVEGSIRGSRVTLQASSHVEGDIFHKSLAIEQGAFFEGKSRRSEDPLNLAGANRNGAVGADEALGLGGGFSSSN